MYFGIKYAVTHVGSDPDLAGLLITGTGDVFAPGGDMGGGGADNWLTFGSALGMDALPFDTLRQSAKPVVAAVNGLCQGGGMQTWPWSASVRRFGCPSSTAASPIPTTARCWRGSSARCGPAT